MSKRVLVIGSNGQDGQILMAALKEKDCQIIGVDKNLVQTFGITYDKKVDITKKKDVFALVKETEPAEIYYLSAFHHSSEEAPIEELSLLEISYQVNYFGYLYFLEAIRLHSPKTKIFYASSSMIFGDAKQELQTEDSEVRPNNAYAITKLDAMLTSKIYRDKYQVFASVGILFNHESVYRPEKFVVMKIIQGAIDIKNKKKDSITLGALASQIDVGYAPDFIDAMQRIMELEKADDFIIATGQKHSIKEIAQIAFQTVGLDWNDYVKEDSGILIRKRVPIVGDYSKLKKATGWEPKTSFENMIEKITLDKLTSSN